MDNTDYELFRHWSAKNDDFRRYLESPRSSGADAASKDIADPRMSEGAVTRLLVAPARERKEMQSAAIPATEIPRPTIPSPKKPLEIAKPATGQRAFGDLYAGLMRSSKPDHPQPATQIQPSAPTLARKTVGMQAAPPTPSSPPSTMTQLPISSPASRTPHEPPNPLKPTPSSPPPTMPQASPTASSPSPIQAPTSATASRPPSDFDLRNPTKPEPVNTAKAIPPTMAAPVRTTMDRPTLGATVQPAERPGPDRPAFAKPTATTKEPKVSHAPFARPPETLRKPDINLQGEKPSGGSEFGKMESLLEEIRDAMKTRQDMTGYKKPPPLSSSMASDSNREFGYMVKRR